MTREDTARHEKTRQGTARHDKARQGTRRHGARGHRIYPTLSLTHRAQEHSAGGTH